MRRLNGNEAALLELLSVKPLTYLPPLHRSIAIRLVRDGMVKRSGGTWSATAEGLASVCKTLSTTVH